MKDIKKVKNPKVGIYYENDFPYMFFEADFKCNDKTYNTKIGKIDLSKTVIKYDVQRLYEQRGCIDSSVYHSIPFDKRIISNITFDILPKDTVFYTMQDVTPYKEMRLEDVEKELGYKIKIVK